MKAAEHMEEGTLLKRKKQPVEDVLPEDLEEAHCQLVRRIHCIRRITQNVEQKDMSKDSLGSELDVDILSNEDLLEVQSLLRRDEQSLEKDEEDDRVGLKRDRSKSNNVINENLKAIATFE